MKKQISNQGRKGQKGRVSKYDIVFRRNVAMQYINGNRSLYEVAIENGITKDQVKDWVKRFSGELAEDIVIAPMTDQELKDYEALLKQNEALQKKLKHEQLKNFALETMLDLAKTELGIDIRKNSGAKQPEE
jgi:transposase-like protein